jgi:hypothetical protein
MLVAEDLIDDYINGNLSKVKEALETAPPLAAAVVAVDLYRFLLLQPTQVGADVDDQTAATFIDRLRKWKQ